MIDPVFELALRSADPVARLRQLAADLLGQGLTREEVLIRFTRTSQQLGADGRENDEDAILDVMDFLVGWCSPHAKINPPAVQDGSGNGADPASQSIPRVID